MRRRVQEGSKKAVDKSEQSSRPKSSRVLSSRAARQRRGGGDHQRGELPKQQREFQLACATWARALGIKLNALFNLMPNYGRSVHWMRERYYGGTFVDDLDIHWVNAALKGEAAQLPVDRMRLYVTAVERMCHYCAGGDEEKTPTCWDVTCPLRSVSPLPLRVTK